MAKIGLDLPRSAAVTSMKEGLKAIENIGFPAILRPAFTLGGTGGGIAYNIEEYTGTPGQRAEAQPGKPGPRRGVGARLERIRTRSHAGHKGQCCHHLFHRKF